MRKIILSSLLSFLFFISLSFSVKASVNTNAVASPTPVVTKVDSFDLFWPIVAGKTVGDKFYGLKILKENIRASLIFGEAQKADYASFLAVKRFVEAEKLIQDKKKDNATQTLNVANSKLNECKKNLELAKSKGQDVSSVKDPINIRLNNLNKLIDYLITQTDGDIQAKLKESKTSLVDTSKSI